MKPAQGDRRLVEKHPVEAELLHHLGELVEADGAADG